METTVKYTSEFTHDLKLQKEFLKGSTAMNPINIVCHLIVTGILIWFFVTMFFFLDASEEFSRSMLLIAVLYALFSGIQMFMNRGGGIHYKRNLLTNGNRPVHSLVQFRDDTIVTINLDTDGKTAIGYDQLKSIQETENLLLCKLKYRLFLIVDKRTLSCSREELIGFLQENCTGIRKKKPASEKAGRIISRIMWLVILALTLVALVFHPTLQLRQRFRGQIHNGMTFAEIQQKLEPVGITCRNPDLPEDLEGIFGTAYYRSGSKLETLLYYAGIGEHDYEAMTWTPSHNGVFYCPYWADDTGNMYTKLLQGISALNSEELCFTNIREDSNIHFQDENGTARVEFDYDGSHYILNVNAWESWYDESVLNMLSDIIGETTGKGLYFYDYVDMGCFIFYGDTQWAEEFRRISGMDIVTDIYDTY